MMKNNIRIQFVDTDMSGRIHYSAIFKYFEMMDHDFFRSIGYSYNEILKLGFHVPRVHVECSYIGEIVYDDELEAQVAVEKVGNSSYTLAFSFFKEEQCVAKGRLTNVFIDRSTGKSAAIPMFIKTELEKHLLRK